MENNLTVTTEQLQQIVQAAITAVNAQSTTNNAQPGNNDGGARPRLKAPERPEVDLGFSETQYAFFEDEWKLYKRRAALTPDQINDELRSCCSKELRKTLFDFVGTTAIDGYTEAQLLLKIKQTAVIGKNKAVHRKEFYEIVQAPDEQLNRFVAKLKAKAERCNFTMQCSGADCDQVINYGNEMLKDQMTTGLYDKDVQQEVLARDKELTTFDEVYTHVEAYEQGKRAKSELQPHHPSSVSAAKSQYKKMQGNDANSQMNDRSNEQTSKRCNGCNSSTHGFRQRERQCPAWGKKCKNCGKNNHFEYCCKQPPSKDNSSGGVSAAATMDQASSALAAMGGTLGSENVSYFYAFSNKLHSLRSSHDIVPVPNIEWDGEKFCKAVPPPLPTLQVRIIPLIGYHKVFLKIDIRVSPNTVIARAFTDTCAQTCVAGRNFLSKTNVPEGVLIPTSHKIKGVTDQHLEILGLLLVEISYNSVKTYGVIYICENVKGIFLSENVQKRLGIISSAYPNVISNACSQTTANGETASSGSLAKCGCPLRVGPPPPPDTIPFSPTKENKGKLEKWILSAYASSAFNTCEHQPIKKLTGKPLDIHWRDDARPVTRHSPVPTPIHFREKAKEDLDRDVRIGVCEPVPDGVPSIWQSAMLVVEKKNGKLRRVVDYQAVNKASLRETHHTPTPFHLASSVPANMVKTLFDAWNGYHALQLTEKAKNALMFITEFGRYRPITAPQGFHGSGDGYTKRTDDIIAGFPRKTKCIDDSLLYDLSIEQAFWHAVDFIILCNTNGIIFNVEKFRFAEEELDFAGFTVTMEGIKPTKQMISTLEGFPTPKNRTDLKSFFGLVQFVSYVFSQSKQLAPFRDLLKKNTEWYWDNSLDEIFSNCKKMIVDQVIDGVKTFQVNQPCALWTDWSKEGVGFSLFQKRCDCALSHLCCKDGWKLVFAKSRFTRGSELGYKPIEGEALAIVYALKKCKIFILGCPKLLVVTDHKPLVPIMGSKNLEKIENPRLFSLKEKTLPFKFDIVHVSGVGNMAADAYSRNPSPDSEDDKDTVIGYMKAFLPYIRSEDVEEGDSYEVCIDREIEASLLASISAPQDGYISAVSLARIKSESSTDESIQQLIKLILDGFPKTKEELPDRMKCYWNVRDHLLVLDNYVLYKNRALVPPKLRREVLETLHSAHQGVVGMRARASNSFFWPGLNHDIDITRGQCRDCNDIAPSQSNEPLILTSPKYPFQKTVADYFSLTGFKYLLYADRYSAWISVIKIRIGEADFKFLKTFLVQLFSTFGVPEELSTDGGPPFKGHEYKTFLQRWDIQPRLSSAYYPQSNGRAELAVKVAKKVLLGNSEKNGDINNEMVARALLQHRNTPLQGIGLSPAQILYGRNLKDCLPSQQDALCVRNEWRIAADDRERALRNRHVKAMETYNEHTTELPDLHENDYVAIQNGNGSHPKRWDRTGRVMEALPFRQYRVKVDGSNRLTLRNRKFLRKIDPVSAHSSSPNVFPTTVSEGSPRSTDDPVNLPLASAPLSHPPPTDSPPSAPLQETTAALPPPVEIAPSSEGVRRGSRLRQPRELFEASMQGKSHGHKPVPQS